MNGLPSLEQFDTELRYLQQHSYAHTFEPIDVKDPIKDGTSDWQKTMKALSLLPDPAIRKMLAMTFGPFLSKRPADIMTGIDLLRQMRETVASAKRCLVELHGKDREDTDEAMPNPPKNLNADWLHPDDVRLQQGDVMTEGIVTGIEKKFYSDRGLTPYSIKELMEGIHLKYNVARVIHLGKNLGKNAIVGHYILKVRDNVLRLSDWAVRSRQLEQQGVPEFMLSDIGLHLHDHTKATKKLTTLEYGIDATHPLPPPDSSRKPLLFP